jgi:hypothetical protein
MANKLTQNLFSKKSWGSEVIWSLTDSYMAKTIEIMKDSRTPLMINQEREKSIIVINGTLYLTFGDCCEESKLHIYKCPNGWSWYIEPGMLHRYNAFDETVRLIEVSSPQLDDTIIFSDDSNIESETVMEDNFKEKALGEVGEEILKAIDSKTKISKKKEDKTKENAKAKTSKKKKGSPKNKENA